MLFKNFEKLCLEKRDNIALQTKNKSYTYNEILDLILILAKRIEQIDNEAITPIGLAFSNSVEFLALIFSNLSIKRTSILLGSSLKAGEIAFHVTNLGAKIVLACPSLEQILTEAGGIKQEPVSPTIDCWFFMKVAKPEFKEGDFICQLTSGTNGNPKAVVRTEKSVWQQVVDTAKRLNLTENDSVLNIPPIHHAYGLINGCLTALLQGARLTLHNGFMPADVIDTIQKNNISILYAVPFMYNILNHHFSNLDQKKQQLVDFSSLRLCLSAGASMPVEIAHTFYSNFKKYVCQNYGSTETGVMSINLDPASHFESVGLPFGDRKFKTCDENGNKLPPNSVGELWYKSEATARAYIYPKDLNPSVFYQGWYKTGDLGRIDKEGYIYLVGRKSSMINVAGLKVDPVEVENIIYKLENIKEVAVVGIPYQMSGQAVKAFVVSTGEIDELDIINHCKKELANFKVPRFVQFLDSLPKTNTGKILKKYLT